MHKRLIIIVLCFAAGLCGTLFAAEPAAQQKEEKHEPKAEVVTNEITGSVSGIGRNYITVNYKHDAEKGAEYEVYFPIDANVQVQNKKNISDIAVGDRVGIIYEETRIDDPDKGKETKRKAKIVRYVGPPEAKPKPPIPMDQGRS